MFVRGLHAPGASGRGPVRNRLRIGRSVPGQPREPRRMDRVVEPVVCSMARAARSPSVAASCGSGARRQPVPVVTMTALLSYFLMIMGPFEGGRWNLTLHQIRAVFFSNTTNFFGGLMTGPLYGLLGQRWRTRRAWISALLVAGALCLEPFALDCRRQDSRREMDHRLDTRRGNRNGGLTAPFRTDDSEPARGGGPPLGLPVRPRVR